METLKNTVITKKEIMVTAWYYKKHNNVSFKDALKEVWRLWHENFKYFLFIFKMALKKKRVDSLKDWDIKKTIISLPDASHTQVSFNLWFWGEKYNAIFKMFP